jgi:hypothetical protein
VTFAYVAALDNPIRDKRLRRQAIAARALTIIDTLAASLAEERSNVVGRASLAQFIKPG